MKDHPLIEFNINPLSAQLLPALQQKLDGKTKPPGALGVLEALALRAGQIQNTLTPALNKATVIVCAGDHGATAEGISAFPQEVTAQMVLNFLNGGAAINVFAQQHGLGLSIVDTGVAYDFSSEQRLIDAKIAAGTKNYVCEPAMSLSQCQRCLRNGAAIVEHLHQQGCNLIGLGEMGIGNTGSATLLMSVFCNLPLERCVGPGTGLDNHGIQHKLQVLKRARKRVKLHSATPAGTDPIVALSEFGGFEIVTLCGAILKAAELGIIVLIDGFTVTAALLAAKAINPNAPQYCIASHCSAETGHALMLRQLKAKPLLDLDLRLGEGSGAALAYPIVQSAVAILNDMASFESAGVSVRQDA